MPLLHVRVMEAQFIGRFSGRSISLSTSVELQIDSITQRTHTIWTNSQPFWNQEFIFEVASIYSNLVVDLCQSDAAAQSRSIGFRVLGVDSVRWSDRELPANWYRLVAYEWLPGTQEPANYEVRLATWIEEA